MMSNKKFLFPTFPFHLHTLVRWHHTITSASRPLGFHFPLTSPPAKQRQTAPRSRPCPSCGTSPSPSSVGPSYRPHLYREQMAAIGARSLALIFGAGYSGSYIYNNQEKARAIADAIVGAANSQKRQTDPASGQTTSNHEFTHLSHQVDRLAREVARNRTDPVIIMGGNGSGYRESIAAVSNIFNLLGWAVVAVSVGGIVYYIAFRKRLRISDLAWVSQTTFNGTIETMQKGLAHVRDTVGAVRHDLSNRLGLLKNQVDGVQTSLSHQIEEEVGGVQKGVNDVGAEVAGVKDMLDTVKSRIDDLDSKMDFATTGIMALIKAVSSVAPQQVQASAFDDLRQISKLSDRYAEIGGGMMQKRLSSTGLAGLLGGPNLDGSNSRISVDMGSPSQPTGKS